MDDANGRRKKTVYIGRRYHSYYGVDKNVMPTDEVEFSTHGPRHVMMLTTGAPPD